MPPRRPITFLAAFALLLAITLVGCEAGRSTGESAPPRRRESGPRWVAFSGGDPVERGWVKVGGGLWVEAAHADAFRRGYLWDGEAYRPADAAEGRHILRTDHVRLETDVPFARARSLAEACEKHAARVFEVFADALDLRIPDEPLPIVLSARRSEFQGFLRGDAKRSVAWGAFYDAETGTVYASDERAAAGGLSVIADLRHEMTHALLDRGTRGGASEAMFHRPHFWLWEGAAIWTEGLGDPESAREGSERIARYQSHVAWGTVRPLAEVFRLTQEAFLGEHYDEVASFMRWLMNDGGGRRRPAVLRLLAHVMSGRAEEGDFERLLGLTASDAQARWLSSLSK